MELSPEQRRAIVALTCKIAWADGVVTDSEREFVRQLVARIASDAVSSDEIDQWLATPTGGPELEYLPSGIDGPFVREALGVMEVDGTISMDELTALREILDRLFARHDDDATISDIARDA